MALAKGIHHVCVRCAGEEEMKRTAALYAEFLGKEIFRSWGAGKDAGCMIDAGNALIEFFANSEPGRAIGPTDHIALAVDDVDACVAFAKEKGCPVTTPPTDAEIHAEPPIPIRIAFIKGFAGESIELFCEKG